MILPLSGFASCTKEVQGKAFKAKSSEKSTSFPLEFNHQAVKPSISHPFTLQERRPPSHRSSSGRVIFLHQVACQEVRTGGQSPWLRKKRRKHTHTHLHLSPSLSISLCLCLSFSLKSLSISLSVSVSLSLSNLSVFRLLQSFCFGDQTSWFFLDPLPAPCQRCCFGTTPYCVCPI